MGDCVSGRIVAIITARQGSTRLPNKALLDICGKPMLHRIVDQVKDSGLINEVVVATSVNSESIIKYCNENNIPFYAGSEYDICDRLYQSAKKFEATTVVYLWGDCPLLNGDLLDDVLSHYSITGFLGGYFSCRHNPTGYYIDVIPFKLLEKAQSLVPQDSRELFHEYMTMPNEVSPFIENMILDDMKPLEDWTVNTQEDLEKVRRIYENM